MVENSSQIIVQWLEGLAASESSTELDATRLANLLRRVGFPRAVVVLGIVYLEGRGTIEVPPTSIQAIAKMLVNKAK